MNVFVFGSNLRGAHGLGAAKTARKKFGAVLGQAFGVQGQSFAIPTKDEQLRTLPLSDVKYYVNKFIIFAQNFSEITFNVTRIGTGLAGYKDQDIAPLFVNSPKNCRFDILWKPWLGEDFEYFEEEL